MFRFLPYLLKTLWRHRTRTLLTVSGSAVALFVFSFVLSVQVGLKQLTEQDDSVLVVFQANKFCPATSHLPQDYELKIREIPGVRNVVPIQVFTNNCRASLDVVVFYGVPAEQVRQARDFTLQSGNWSEFETHQDAGIVGQRLATRRNLKTGDKFTVGTVNVTVAGIFTSRNPSEEDYVYCHLGFLQRTRGLDLVGTVTQHEVFLTPGADPATVASAIDERLKGGTVRTDTRTKGVFQASSLADLIDLIDLSKYLGYACLGLMTVLLSTTTIMTVEDRVQQHAVLQTLGVSTGRIFRLVLAECLLLSVLGGCIGIFAAAATLTFSGMSIGAEAVTIAFTPSLEVLVTGAVVTVIVGLIAGLAPAWRASRAEIVPALRSIG